MEKLLDKFLTNLLASMQLGASKLKIWNVKRYITKKEVKKC